MLKFPLSFPPPRRASRTWLPAVAAALLLCLLALQLGWTRPIVLPQDEPITPTRLDPVSIVPVLAAPIILRRAMFGEGGDAASGNAPGAGPLDGAVAVGVLARGGRSLVFLQAPGGAVTTLAPGAVYHGWTLVRLGAAGLLVRRGAETATLRIGPSQSAGTTPEQPAPAQ